MPPANEIYTYRNGKKVLLKKQPNQFVIRAQPRLVEDAGFDVVERVSPSSTRVTTNVEDLEPSMSMFRHLAPTHHAYTKVETEEEFLITDRILITFSPGTPEDEVDRFAGKYALVKTRKYSATDYLFQLTTDTGMNPVKLVVLLTEEEPLVEMVEHDLNKRMEKYAVPVPEDPYYRRQWHLHERLQDPQFDPRADAGCETAWNLLNSFGDPDVVVGFTDDGCLLDHPDFDSQAKFAGWGYFQQNRLITSTDFDAQPDRMYEQYADHGTAVAGVIAGEVDATHAVGAAPGCRLLPVKWESEGPALLISDSKLLDALDYLSDKVDIISNSWGSSPVSEWSVQVVNRIRNLSESGGRRGKGILFLWAAGNENCPIQYEADIDIPYTNGWRFYPDGSRQWVGVRTSRIFRHNLVELPGVMHIAALASTAKRSHYSNYGPGIALCAPSSNGHTYGRMAVEGLGIITATGQPTGITFTFGGTSSATPLVAGIAALVISANPNLKALEIRSILQQTAAKNLDMSGYPRTPPASYNPDTSWDVSPVPPFDTGEFTDTDAPDGSWSPWFGHGVVDAAAAVAEAQSSGGAGAGEEIFRRESSPDLTIPDDNTSGITDVINCPRSGRVEAIEVEVDIPHTYLGDLVVSLTAPSGKKAMLHNRNGGSSDNLQTTFTTANTPALSSLLNEDMEGDWTLHVRDLAARDVGKLKSWTLAIGTHGDREIIADQESAVDIPDNDPNGAESRLTIDESGVISTVEVSVDITHSYISDLRITLFAPDDTAVILHNRTGGGADNIIRTYSFADTPALRTLQGKSFEGAWKLTVVDLANLDRGKVNRWGLRILPA